MSEPEINSGRTIPAEHGPPRQGPVSDPSSRGRVSGQAGIKAEPLTPIFDELQQTAIENGYWGRAELDGVEITASFSPYRGGTTMKFRDTAGSLSFQFSGIDGDQIEQVARIIVAGIRAENPISEGHDLNQDAALDRCPEPQARPRTLSHD